MTVGVSPSGSVSEMNSPKLQLGSFFPNPKHNVLTTKLKFYSISLAGRPIHASAPVCIYFFYELLEQLAILYNGPPKSEACWSGRR